MAEMKDEIITFKVSGEEAAMIRKAAADEKMTVSRYIRACVLRDRGLSGDPVALRVLFGSFKDRLKKDGRGRGRRSGNPSSRNRSASFYVIHISKSIYKALSAVTPSSS